MKYFIWMNLSVFVDVSNVNKSLLLSTNSTLQCQHLEGHLLLQFNTKRFWLNSSDNNYYS